MRIYVDKRKAVILLAIAALFVGPIAVWNLQSLQKRNEFIAEVRAGKVTQFPPYLQEKQWSERDLKTVRVKKLIPFRGHRGELSETMYTFGQYTLSAAQYSYQASMVDTTTGMKYMFGCQKRGPQRWAWAGIHPDSHEQWIQQRAREVEALEGEYYDEGKINELRRNPPTAPSQSLR